MGISLKNFSRCYGIPIFQKEETDLLLIRNPERILGQGRK